MKMLDCTTDRQSMDTQVTSELCRGIKEDHDMHFFNSTILQADNPNISQQSNNLTIILDIAIIPVIPIVPIINLSSIASNNVQIF